MDDSEMVAMFEALMASGLNGFLGCMSDIYETALIEFYQNASVRDGKVVSTVQGKLVEISEEIFSRTFQLPVEGLLDINEVPKDLIFDARTEFSLTGDEASQRLRCPYLFLLNNIPDLELGDSMEFPPLKILTAKTVGRYMAINDKISIDNVEGLAGKSRVKKTPVEQLLVLSNLSLLFRGNIVEFKFDKISDLGDLSFRRNERSELLSAESTEYVRSGHTQMSHIHS
ncbi:hypothetical protein F511_42359 [Dorcoceras hygrometricum]|uniref:Uncharacterized protein n=1 Tax=Dorcoceras hygrometricum TaxID=472368 RepID=A0A2Z7AC02_9LAMI|nr:hypothetical protein F511_42359 [Dorcoceras hygrometricum]